jgi:hypothetical protein
MLEDEEEAEEAPTASGVPPVEQRALRGTASGRDAAGQPDAGLRPAHDGEAAEGSDGEAEDDKVRVMASRIWSGEVFLAWQVMSDSLTRICDTSVPEVGPRVPQLLRRKAAEKSTH